jgi:hypothetical protein
LPVASDDDLANAEARARAELEPDRQAAMIDFFEYFSGHWSGSDAPNVGFRLIRYIG